MAAASCRLGDIVVCWQDGGPISAAEWEEFLADMRKGGGVREARVLVVTHGTNPNSEQRRQLRLELAGVRTRAAIVSDHPIVRFGTSIMSYVTPNIAVFGLRRFSAACDHLKLGVLQRCRVRRALVELEARVRGSAQRGRAR